MKRTGRLKRYAPLLPGGRLRSRSAKTARKYRQIRVPLVRDLLEEYPMCQRCRAARSTDVHEPKKRSRGGSITGTDEVVALCRPCHEETELHPADATLEGLLLPSHPHPLLPHLRDRTAFTTDASCWLWTRSVTAKGYGRINTKLFPGHVAHRAAWIATIGPIAAGLFVCHRCDNPPCVRPSHLWLGTASDNSADMVAKSRSARTYGISSPVCKLTDEQVLEARQRRAGGEMLISIAAGMGVSASYLSRLTRGQRRQVLAHQNPAAATAERWMKHSWEVA